VDVTLKIYRVEDVDVRNNTFSSVFNVMLDWEDPSVSLANSEDQFDGTSHFAPKYAIDNASSVQELGDGRRSHPRRDNTTWHVKWTSKYQAVLKTPLNPEKYPFDFQELRYSIKPNTVDSSILSFLTAEPYKFTFGSRIHVQFQHPLRWRRHSGHSLEKNADWLPDFDIVGIHAERDQHTKEMYSIVVGIKRDPSNIICNVLVSMLVTSVISSFSFFISEFADALAVVLTALLTAVAFKLVLAETLPLTPKPSAIEQYINFLLYQFALQACLNLTIHLATANLADGFFAPEGDDSYSCEAESSYYMVALAILNATGPVSALGPQQHLWWCNFLSVINFIFFMINLVILAAMTFHFLHKKKTRVHPDSSSRRRHGALFTRKA